MILSKNYLEINKNKYILRAVNIAIFLIAISFCISEKYAIYYKMIEIMNIVFIGAIILMTNRKYSRNNNKLSVTLGLGLTIVLILSIIKFLRLDYEFMNLSDERNKIILELYYIIINFLKFLVIIIAIKSKNNHSKFKMKNILRFTILIIIFIRILASFKIIEVFFNDYYYKNGMNYLINLTIYLWSYIYIINSRYIITKNQKRTLVIFVNLTFLANFVTGFNLGVLPENINNKFMVISYGINYIAYYFLYEGLISNSLESYYNNIYEYILRREKSIRQKNTILENRTIILQELNLLVEKSKNYHNEFINSINDFICIFKDSKIEYINKSALSFISGDFDSDYLKKKIKEFYEEVIREQVGKKSKFELTLLDKFDELIDLEIYYIDLKDNYSFLFMKNITAEKRANEKIEYLKKYYEEEYLKREFFSNISHELRTPINVISSAIQLNEINLENHNLEKVQNNNNIIKQNSLRLIRTINNFIDVNRISENYIRGDYKLYNLVELVETILQCSKKYFEKLKMDFIFDTEEEEIFIKIDSNFTERVILNILSNCIKYGKVEGKVYIDIKIEGEKVKIYIENDGRLISKEEEAYIFDKFTKNNKSFNRDQEGSGLGLYISKSLMEIQGGKLEVSKNEKEKNIFIITFELENSNLAVYKEEFINWEIYLSDLAERVDIEFADIYL